MARGRMIDKRVSMSKKIGAVSDKAKTLWFMIYPHLDREGRIAFDDLQDLKVEIIPYFQSWTLKKIEVALNELADIKLLKLYPNDTKIAMQFNRFDDFQIGLRKEREAKSEIVPPGETPETSGNFRIFSLSLRKYKYNEGMKEGKKKVNFDFNKREWNHILVEDLEFWEKAYSSCDIKYELLSMADWLISNPEKKKSNYRAFISRWLRKQQDQGGTKQKQRKGEMNPKLKKFLEEED
jgi:hypothetical protein